MKRLFAFSTVIAIAAAIALTSACERTRNIAGPTVHDTTHTVVTDTITQHDTTIVTKHDTTVVVDTIRIINGPDTVFVFVPDSIIVTDTLVLNGPPGLSTVTTRNVSSQADQHPWMLQFTYVTGPNGTVFGQGKLAPGANPVISNSLNPSQFISLYLWAHQTSQPSRTPVLWLTPGNYEVKLNEGNLSITPQ